MKDTIGTLWLALIPLFATTAVAEGEWEPSTLSEATWDSMHQAKVDYDACLSEQLHKQIGNAADPRAVSDAILKNCEDKLAPARAALSGEKVPPEMIDRYLRQQRSRAAQAVVREVMGAQAVRQAQQAPTAQ